MLRQAHFKRQPRKIRRTSFSLPDINAASQKEYSWKSLCKEAEREFLKTEYERALVLYHRALKERPNCSEARTGIRRCKESLNTILIQPIEKLSVTRCNSKATSRASRRSRRSSKPGTAKYSLFEWANDLTDTYKEEDPFEPTVDMRHDAIHVFTLRSNRTYMRAIYEQLSKSLTLKEDDDIKRILRKEMKYVSTRGYFWRHQIPEPTVPKLFKVKQEQEVVVEEPPMTSEEATAIVTEQLSRVLDAHQHGRHEEATELGKECIEVINKISILDVDYKDEVLGTAYSIIGNSYFEMDEVTESIEWHEKDLKFARRRYLEKSESRALGNLGRSYAKAGDFEKAIELWTEKVPLCEDDSEKAWLHHEMGYCYLTMNNFSMANQCGIMSYEAAERANDYDWQQNSCVLIAQAAVAMGFLQNAMETYNQALYLCDITRNEEMRESISQAMEQVSAYMEQSGQEYAATQHPEEESDPPRLQSRTSLNSDHGEILVSSDNASITSTLSLQKQTSRQTSQESAQLQRNSSAVSQVSESDADMQRTKPKRKVRVKQILKSATSSNFEETSNNSNKHENRFKSKSHVSFKLPVSTSRVSLRSTHDTSKEQRDGNSHDNDTRDKLENNTSSLPSINNTALVSQPVTSNQTSPVENEAKYDTGNLFDDDDYNTPPGSRQSISGQGFYLNTSRGQRGRVPRTPSAHSRPDSAVSTDPRNALADSDDVLSYDLRQSRESWSRHSRRSVLSNL